MKQKSPKYYCVAFEKMCCTKHHTIRQLEAVLDRYKTVLFFIMGIPLGKTIYIKTATGYEKKQYFAHPIQPGIILWMRPANDRRRYIATSSLIGWVQTQNDPWTTESKR